MGFPLRSNIFRSGTSEQAYFARFPIQVAVLFSPMQRYFSEAFRDAFLQLDRLTGDEVAFFAALDPPEDWLEVARNREWWRDYQFRVGQSGFSFNDRVLVREIARLFGVEWDYLPSIVVGTNLWIGEFAVSETSPDHIEKQLARLTDLAREWGQPNIGHIIDALQDSFGFEVRYHAPDDDLRYRFNRFYGALDTVPSPNANSFNREQYRNIVSNELRSANIAINQVRRRNDQVDQSETQAVDKVIEDAAGRLVAVATVATKVVAIDTFERLTHRSDILDILDDESNVMIDTSIRVGTFLEMLNNDNIAPSLLGHRRDDWRGNELRNRVYRPFDFTPGAQGAWKAFEREVNLSIIQAARHARTIKMPDFFALYDGSVMDARFCKVDTGRRTPVDINQRDWEDPRGRKQRFLTLGDAWHVVNVMNGSTGEVFDTIVLRCLRGPLPRKLLDDWRTIYEIRNQASHTRPLARNEYETILESALSPENLYPLAIIKQTLYTRS